MASTITRTDPMPMKFAHRYLAAGIMFCSVTVISVPSLMATPQLAAIDIFSRFTQHIQRQAETDKKAFAAASQCMNWFYKQQRQRPAPPAVQRIAWAEQADSPWSAADSPEQEASDCRSRYPEGIDAVRTDFQRTQALLSLSLTFYEFALVGDGDDKWAYSSRELRDILIALDLSTEPSLGAASHLLALTSTFDTLHNARGMEALMTGMGKLYDQGYRVTTQDKARLNRVME